MTHAGTHTAGLVPYDSVMLRRRVRGDDAWSAIPLLEEMIREARPAWMGWALCRTADGVNFHPARGEDASAAIECCRRCPVQAPCLDYALEHHPHGIWGGTSGRERRLIRKRARVANPRLQSVA